VGIILVTALLISPGATAFLWTKRFDRMMAIACGTAVFSTVSGIFLSYHFDLRSGPCIVLVQALLFVFSMVLGPRWMKKMGRMQENPNKIKAS
jgi:manganese/iron transport system permease protein